MHKDEKSRLVDCFATVFPSLGANQIVSLNQATLAQWDSMATVTLIALVEEEFHVEIPVTEMENLVSFDNFLSVVTCCTLSSHSR